MINRRLERARTVVHRATLVPLLIRAGIALSLILAMAVAWPAELVAGRYLGLLIVIAIYPAVAPRGRGTTAAILTVVAGWVADTSWYDTRVALWRVLAIATLVYLGHTLAALAAQLPYDSVVNLDVVTGWLIRAGGVVLISAVLTVIALGLSDQLAGGAFVIATLVGLAAAVGATMLLARLLRRSGN
ncbi:MAG TPA: hypothetical protein VFR35_05295 [Actinoplanes sp.]|nr:hypothetical protein [Actinoplanes sp.]